MGRGVIRVNTKLHMESFNVELFDVLLTGKGYNRIVLLREATNLLGDIRG
jgi:hypothetical protein